MEFSDMILSRKVDNCQQCPFCNSDNEYGYDRCNLNKDIVMKGFEMMPENHVHELCPLKGNNGIKVWVAL
jgi:hypothetical protein